MQFRLREVVIWIGLLSAPLAIAAAVRRELSFQNAIKSVLEDKGCRFEFLPQPPEADQSEKPLDKEATWNRIVGIDLAARLDDPGNDAISHLDDLQWLTLRGAAAGDEILAMSNSRHGLRYLTLVSPAVSAKGVESLRGLSIQGLSLSVTEVTARDLQVLAQLPLSFLRLGTRTAVDDEMLAVIGQLSQLKDLTIVNYVGADDGLKHLSNLTELRQLEIRGDRLTDEGLCDLAKLPNLQGLIANEGEWVTRVRASRPKLAVTTVQYLAFQQANRGSCVTINPRELERMKPYLVPAPPTEPIVDR